MSRELHPSTLAGLQDKVVRPALIGRLDFLGDPVRAWTGFNPLTPIATGDAALDGGYYLPVAPFIDLSEISENQDSSGPVTLTMDGSSLDETALRQVIRDKRKWLGRPAWLWLALLADDGNQIIGDPIRIKTGVMTSFDVIRTGKGSMAAVTIDNDLGRAKGRGWRITDHSEVFPNDTFSTYMIRLANKPGGVNSAAERLDKASKDPRNWYAYPHD